MCGRTGSDEARVSSHLTEGYRSSHSSTQRKKGVILAPRTSPLASCPLQLPLCAAKGKGGAIAGPPEGRLGTQADGRVLEHRRTLPFSLACNRNKLCICMRPHDYEC